MAKLYTRAKSIRKKTTSKKAPPKAKLPIPTIIYTPIKKLPSPPPPPTLQYTVNWEIYWRNQYIKSNIVPSDKFYFSRWVGEVIKIINIKAIEYDPLYRLEKVRYTLTSGNKGDSYDLVGETEEDQENLLSIIKIWRNKKRPRITVAIKYFYSPPTNTITATGSNNKDIDSKPIIIESDDSEYTVSPHIAQKRKSTKVTNIDRIEKTYTTTTTVDY